MKFRAEIDDRASLKVFYVMKQKSLADSNPYLRRNDAEEKLAVNLATSTAVETGRPASDYVKRFKSRHGDKVSAASVPAHRKKSPA